MSMSQPTMSQTAPHDKLILSGKYTVSAPTLTDGPSYRRVVIKNDKGDVLQTEKGKTVPTFLFPECSMTHLIADAKFPGRFHAYLTFEENTPAHKWALAFTEKVCYALNTENDVNNLSIPVFLDKDGKLSMRVSLPYFDGESSFDLGTASCYCDQEEMETKVGNPIDYGRSHTFTGHPVLKVRQLTVGLECSYLNVELHSFLMTSATFRNPNAFARQLENANFEF